MLKNNLKNFFLGILFLLMNVFSLGEVPHSYVTENPKKEVQEVETFKQKEKAEMNLSVTKVKTKEIGGLINEVTGEFQLNLNKLDNRGNNIVVTKERPLEKNPKMRSFNKDILESKVEDNLLSINKSESNEKLFFNVLNSAGEVIDVYTNKIEPRYHTDNPMNMYFEIDNEYEGGIVRISNEMWRTGNVQQPKGVKFLSYNRGEHFSFKVRKPVTVSLNDKPVRVDYGDRNSHDEWLLYFPHQTLTLSDDLKIELSSDLQYGGDRYIKIKFLKFPENPEEQFVLHFYKQGNINDSTVNTSSHNNFYFKYVIRPIKGDSTVTFAEYYPVNEFVQFTANELLQNAKPLALDNSVRDVSLNANGKGLMLMQQDDKLIVDGHQVVIGAGGNIGPQKLEIGSLKYTYEVKNGKFRIALNEWGVLEPNRTIPINIKRMIKGKETSVVEHNLTLKAPRKVSGTSGVKLNQDYNLGEFIRFNGISLEGAGALGLENPIPLGVSLASTTGQGIPFMKEGDRLEISDDLTRAVKTFTVGPNGNLAKQQVSLKSGDIIIYTESGKLRVSAINWVLNKPIKLNLGLIKGTNRVMDHSLEIQVPDAPFKVTKKGILDFGNVSSGTKRTAETDIGIEMMISDVEIVDFKLKDPNPTMENLTTGDTLAVDKIEYLVIKKDDKKYDIRLKGDLTIPEATKSGTYTGSTTMQLRLR